MDATPGPERSAREIELEARLAAVERRLTATVSEVGRTWELTPDLLCVFDAEGRFLHWNPAWQRVLGWSSEVLGHTVFLELLHPDDLARTVAELDRIVVERQAALNFENRYRHADGSWRWLSWVAVLEDGRIYCIARDITADKERRARLAERDVLWRASDDLYVTVGPDGLYREVNPAFRTGLGHEPEALVATRFDALAHREDVTRVRDAFALVLDGGRCSDLELRMRHVDGGWRWYGWTAFRVGDLVLGIGRDIDARKRQEAELQAAEEALHQSRKLEMIGQLTGGIAHDFNNLLMAMQSSLELLDGSLDADDGTRRALVGNALAGAARGAALTQRLLAFARRQDLAPGPVDVGVLIGGMTELLAHSLGPRVIVRTMIADDAPTAAVDGNQLEMALLNLAVNARDAMDGEGELTFTVCGHRSPGHGPVSAGDYVRVTVADTGSGMDAATLEKATEPFFTTKEIGSGTGLGLSMVHGLAQQSGGGFRLTSEPDVGTVAEILLPAAAAAAPLPASGVVAEAARPPAPRPRRILVVDDDELVLRGMVGILSRLGHEVLSAASGALGLQVLAREGPVDIVVTDQLMPGMTGLELAAAVRRDHLDTAVVLASGYTDMSGVSADLVDARLAKPFDRRRLQAVIDGVRAPSRVDLDFGG